MDIAVIDASGTRAGGRWSWLIANIRSYLTGFFNRRNQAKTRKDSQK
jgi:hypothetical protein